MNPEVTPLPAGMETQFAAWLKANQITDLDHPDSHYDYRGAYLAGLSRGGEGHFPDTFKQHGHPTFSIESQYSKGPTDGGRWVGETFVPAMTDPKPKKAAAPDTVGLKQRLAERGKALDKADAQEASFEPFLPRDKAKWTKAGKAASDASGAFFSTQDSLTTARSLLSKLKKGK